MPENMESSEQKPRPIIRVGLFIISHSILVSAICCTAGILALFLLPVLAKNTYISENALMPGSATPMLTDDDASEGQMLVNKILSLDSKTLKDNEIPELIADLVRDLGGVAHHHKFPPQFNKFQPLQFFLGPDAGTIHANSRCSSYGINTVGIIRAPRGEGKECIVLVTPYNPINITTGEALSLGVAYSLFSLLSRATWLAKDIVWLAADSRYGEYFAVAEWLMDYNTLSVSDLNQYPEISDGCTLHAKNTSRSTELTSEGFYRAGTMAAALVVKVTDSNTEFGKDVLKIYAEASNGQMPNLDLFNIVNYLAVHSQGLHVRVEKFPSMLDWWWLNSLGQVLALIGNVARSLNPQWNFGIPVAEYVEGTATLANSLYNQAIGVPTGAHGAFRDYQVDAITMEISPKFSSTNKVRILLRVGSLIEAVLKSVNNLLEKFHQSFFLYLLTSPSRFVSVGVYMIAFALLIAPFPLLAASLFSDATKSYSAKHEAPLQSDPANKLSITFTSWTWFYATKTVLVVHMWGFIVALIPYLLFQIPESSPSTNLLSWIILSMITFFSITAVSDSTSPPRQIQSQQWALLKSVTIAASFIGLCLMSVINFATAEIGALLLAPMCLTVVPLRLNFKANTWKALAWGVFNILLSFTGFPLITFLALKGSFQGLEKMEFGEFWKWVESLWAWNSATYIYICMVHLPCWVLCIKILLHR